MNKKLFLKIYNESLEDYDDEVSDVEITDIGQPFNSRFDDTQFDPTMNRQLQSDDYFLSRGYSKAEGGENPDLFDKFTKKVGGRNGSTRTIKARRKFDKDTMWRDDPYGEGSYDDGSLLGKEEWDDNEKTPLRRDINKRNIAFDDILGDTYSDNLDDWTDDNYNYGDNAVEMVDYDV